MPASAVVAIRGRVGQPRFARERLRRDMIELELRRFRRQARRTGMPGQGCNRALHHRVAFGSGRGDHHAGSVKDEGSTVRANGVTSQHRDESVFALGVNRRRRTFEVVVQLHADVCGHCLMELRRQPLRIIVCVPKGDSRGGANHHENQCNEWCENEDPDWQAFLCLSGAAPRVPAT